MPELSANGPARRRRWTDGSLRRLCSAILIGLLLSVIIAAALDPKHRKLLGEGDFPGFYTPAFTIVSGQAERLYDLELQQKLQARFFGGEEGFYISVYPPYFCVVFAPFALLPPWWSKQLATALMVIFFLLATRLASGFTPVLGKYRFELRVLLFAWPPLLFALAASQNTALSLLLYTGALYFFRRRTPEGDFCAGILLGAWLYKPQYGLAALLLPLLARKWWAAAGGLLPIAVYAWLGYTVLGSDWLTTWAAAAAKFGIINYDINGHQMVSLVGALRALGAKFSEDARWWGTVCGWGASAALGGALTVQFLKANHADPDEAWRRFDRAFLRLAPALVLFTPQTLFYDLGIAGIAIVHCLKLRTDREINWLLVLLALSYVATFLRTPGGLPFQLPFALIACWFVWKRTAPEPA